jgi:hypothetical protein
MSLTGRGHRMMPPPFSASQIIEKAEAIVCLTRAMGITPVNRFCRTKCHATRSELVPETGERTRRRHFLSD